MELAYVAANYFIEVLFRNPNQTIDFNNLKTFRKLIGKEVCPAVADYLDKENEDDFLFIFRNFPDVFLLKPDAITFTDTFSFLYKHLDFYEFYFNGARDKRTILYLENYAVSYFYQCLKSLGPRHYVFLFTRIMNDTSNPFNSYFRLHNVFDSQIFFEAHADVFLVSNDIVSLRKEKLLTNPLLSKTLAPNIMLVFENAVYFLLTCFKSLHYMELRQCICYVFIDVKNILNRFPVIKQRELFAMLPRLNMTELGYISLKCINVNISIPTVDKTNLFIVCLLAFKKSMHYKHIVKEVNLRVPSTSDCFKGLAEAELLQFFNNFPLLFKTSCEGYITLLPTFIFPVFTTEILYNQQNDHDPSKSVDIPASASTSKKSILVPVTIPQSDQSISKTDAKILNDNESLQLQVAPSLQNDENCKYLFSALMLPENINKQIRFSILFLVKHFHPVDKQYVIITLFHVMEEVHNAFFNLSITDRRSFISYCGEFINSLSDHLSMECIDVVMLEGMKKELLLLFIVYLITSEKEMRMHFQKIVKSVEEKKIKNSISSLSVSELYKYFKGIKKYLIITSDGYVSLTPPFKIIKRNVDIYTGCLSEKCCTSNSKMVKGPAEKDKLTKAKMHPTVPDILNCSFPVTGNKVPLDIRKILLTAYHLFRKHKKDLDIQRIFEASVFILEGLRKYVSLYVYKLSASERNDVISECYQFIRKAKSFKGMLQRKVFCIVDIGTEDRDNLFIAYFLTEKENHIQSVIGQLRMHGMCKSLTSKNDKDQFKYFEEMSQYFIINAGGYVSPQSSLNHLKLIINGKNKVAINKSNHSTLKTDVKMSNDNKILQLQVATPLQNDTLSVIANNCKHFPGTLMLPESINKQIRLSILFLVKHFHPVNKQCVIITVFHVMEEVHNAFCTLPTSDKHLFISFCSQLINALTDDPSKECIAENIFEGIEKKVLLLFIAYLLTSEKKIHFEKIVKSLEDKKINNPISLLSVSEQYNYFQEMYEYLTMKSNGYVSLAPPIQQIKKSIDTYTSLTSISINMAGCSNSNPQSDHSTSKAVAKRLNVNESLQLQVAPSLQNDTLSIIDKNCKYFFNTLMLSESINKQTRLSILFLVKYFHPVDKQCVFMTLFHVMEEVRNAFCNLSIPYRRLFITYCSQFINAISDHISKDCIAVAMFEGMEKEMLLLFIAYLLTSEKEMHFQKIIKCIKKKKIRHPISSLTVFGQYNYFLEMEKYLRMGGDGYVSLAPPFEIIKRNVYTYTNFLSEKCCTTNSEMIKEIGRQDKSAMVSEILNFSFPVTGDKVPLDIRKILLTAYHLFRKHKKALDIQRIFEASVFVLVDLGKYVFNLSVNERHDFICECYQFLAKAKSFKEILKQDDFFLVQISPEERNNLFIAYYLSGKDTNNHIQSIIDQLKKCNACKSSIKKVCTDQFKYFEEMSQYFIIDSDGYITFQSSFNHLKQIIDIGPISDLVFEILYRSFPETGNKVPLYIRKILLTAHHLCEKYINEADIDRFIKASVFILEDLRKYVYNLSMNEQNNFINECRQLFKVRKLKRKIKQDIFCLVDISTEERDNLLIAYILTEKIFRNHIQGIIDKLMSHNVCKSLTSKKAEDQFKYFEETSQYFSIDSDGYITFPSSFNNLKLRKNKELIVKGKSQSIFNKELNAVKDKTCKKSYGAVLRKLLNLSENSCNGEDVNSTSIVASGSSNLPFSNGTTESSRKNSSDINFVQTMKTENLSNTDETEISEVESKLVNKTISVSKLKSSHETVNNCHKNLSTKSKELADDFHIDYKKDASNSVKKSLEENADFDFSNTSSNSNPDNTKSTMQENVFEGYVHTKLKLKFDMESVSESESAFPKEQNKTGRSNPNPQSGHSTLKTDAKRLNDNKVLQLQVAPPLQNNMLSIIDENCKYFFNTLMLSESVSKQTRLSILFLVKYFHPVDKQCVFMTLFHVREEVCNAFCNLSISDRRLFIAYCSQFINAISKDVSKECIAVTRIEGMEKEMLLLFIAYLLTNEKEMHFKKIVKSIEKKIINNPMSSLSVPEQYKYIQEMKKYINMGTNGYASLVSPFELIKRNVDSYSSFLSETCCTTNSEMVKGIVRKEKVVKICAAVSEILNYSFPVTENIVSLYIRKILLTSLHNLFKKYRRAVDIQRMFEASVFVLRDLRMYIYNLSVNERNNVISECYQFIAKAKILNNKILSKDVFCVVDISTEEIDNLFITYILSGEKTNCHIKHIIDKLKSCNVCEALKQAKQAEEQFQYFKEKSQYFIISADGYITFHSSFNHLKLKKEEPIVKAKSSSMSNKELNAVADKTSKKSYGAVLKKLLDLSQNSCNGDDVNSTSSTSNVASGASNLSVSNEIVENSMKNSSELNCTQAMQTQNLSNIEESEKSEAESKLANKTISVSKLKSSYETVTNCHGNLSIQTIEISNEFDADYTNNASNSVKKSVEENVNVDYSIISNNKSNPGNKESTIQENVFETNVPKTDLDCSELLSENYLDYKETPKSSQSPSDSALFSDLSNFSDSSSAYSDNLHEKKRETNVKKKSQSMSNLDQNAAKDKANKKSSNPLSYSISSPKGLDNEIVENKITFNSSIKSGTFVNKPASSSEQLASDVPNNAFTLEKSTDISKVSESVSVSSEQPLWDRLALLHNSCYREDVNSASSTSVSKLKSCHETVKNCNNNLSTQTEEVSNEFHAHYTNNTSMSLEENYYSDYWSISNKSKHGKKVAINDKETKDLSFSARSSEVPSKLSAEINSNTSCASMYKTCKVRMPSQKSYVEMYLPNTAEFKKTCKTEQFSKTFYPSIQVCDKLSLQNNYNFSDNGVSFSSSIECFTSSHRVDPQNLSAKLYFSNASTSEEGKSLRDLPNISFCDTATKGDCQIAEVVKSNCDELKKHSSNPSEKSSIVTEQSAINLKKYNCDSIQEMRAVNFFCVVLGNYRKYNCGISADFLKKHLVQASGEVQAVIRDNYENDFLSFFKKHKNEFYVSPRSQNIYLQKK